MVSAQYPIMHHIDGFGKLCQMCLASTLFHRAFVMDFPSNHVAHTTSQAYRHAPMLNFFSENEDAITTTMPWADHQHHFSGIPPHVTALHDLMVVRDEQRLLVDQIIDKMGTLLDKRGIEQGGGQNLREVLGDGLNNIRLCLDQIEAGRQLQQQQQQKVVEGGGENINQRVAFVGHSIHHHHGVMVRVPADWHFPRVGVLDAWQNWWIGDSVRRITPLRFLERGEVDWLAKIPLGEDELHGRTGRNSRNRRNPRKTLADYRFLMETMVDRVKAKGNYVAPNVATIGDEYAMFNKIADGFYGIRDVQKRWTTVVNEICDCKADDRREANGLE
ncbi:hypothetical protein ACA910_012235 [Epithemia clementina (nom. ined.)]